MIIEVKMSSEIGPWRLTMQQDNNLVLYDYSQNATWSSKTHRVGTPGSANAKVTSNGHFIVYLSDSNEVIWDCC